MTQSSRRIILNFANRCALNCEWCYVPFEARKANADTVLRILDRIESLGFANITIGGGDPFQYAFLQSVVSHAKELGLFVHVDTHGKSLKQSNENRYLIENYVDLLGLPIDGPTSTIHDHMRSSRGHFDIVMDHIQWLTECDTPIKINTVVSRLNIESLFSLGNLITEFKPSRWSIYEYWPLGPGASVKGIHEVSSSEFLSNCSELKSLFSSCPTILEVNPKLSRRSTYPIVHNDGEVYLHAEKNLASFDRLGSIFESETALRILELCVGDRIEATTRYSNQG